MYSLKNYTKRIFLITEHVRDELILNDISCVQLDHYLHIYLKNKLNYDSVVLLDAKGIYYFDDKSRDVLKNRQKQTTVKKKGLSKLKRHPQKITLKREETLKSPGNENRLRFTYEGDILEITQFILNHLRQDHAQFAFVVYDGSLFEKLSIPSDIWIQMQGMLRNEIYNLHSSNKNIFIWVNGDDYETLSKYFARLGLDFLFAVPQNKDEPSGKAQLIRVPGACKDEVQRTVSCHAVKNDSFPLFEDVVKYAPVIAGNMRQKQDSLQTLNQYLNETETKDFMSNIKKCYGIENEIQPAFEQLKAMTGLDSVKNAITNIVKGIEKKEKIFEDDYELTPERFKKIKKNSLPYIPHLALLGNPGTGKTTIALLIGKILREEGILESGHLVEVTRGDLVAGYSGQTAIKTNEQIHKALGGVLFIDEAYTLINGEQDSYGRESLGELIKAMDKYEGQFVVIFAGYKNETQTMLTCNPGSARRVKHIELSDYSANELHEIMKARLEQIPMHVSNEIYDNLQTFCANLLSNREQFGGNHFGNAGVVVKQIENALQAARARNARKLLPEHFESPLFFQKLKKGQEDLEELIGLETIKSQLKILFKRNKIESMPPGHYIFSGNPGTGKTIVAQQIANKFYEMNLLKSAKLNKYTASTLIGGHLGSTENKINKILKESLEGVLFIDEAHQLASPHSYGNKVVEAIIPFMEDNRKNFCLICAGYPEKLKNLFKLDPGFKNRFNRTITFEDYSTDELVQIFHKMFSSEQSYYELENITDQILQTCFKTIKQSEGDFFSNARTVRKFIEELKNCAIENVQSNNSKIYITSQHVEIVKTQWKEHDETD